MGIIDILLTAVGLSMDASAVGMTNGMNEPKMPLRKIFLVAGFYGVFQGLMPLIGYLCASLFAQFVASVAPYVALVLLGFIGGKMIYEACKKEDACALKPLSLGTLTVQAIATSIDALAVGITLLAYDALGTLAVNVFLVCAIFSLVTFALTLIAVFIGKKVGCMLSDKAELIGGIILVCIGLKIFIEGVIVPLF
ncbi:MAG: manganese efflux pump [Clostridia bacterium]|nr:manganese efflux pump [Clostridia bacterium]